MVLFEPSPTLTTFIAPDEVIAPPKEILLAVILFIPEARRSVLVALPMCVRTKKLPAAWFEEKADKPDKFTTEPLGRGPMIRSAVPATVRLPFKIVEKIADEPVDGSKRFETD